MELHVLPVVKNLKDKASRARARSENDSVSSSLAAGKRNNYSSFLSRSSGDASLGALSSLSLSLSIGVYQLVRRANKRIHKENTNIESSMPSRNVACAFPNRVLYRKRQLSKARRDMLATFVRGRRRHCSASCQQLLMLFSSRRCSYV